jgi:hypothetical protein
LVQYHEKGRKHAAAVTFGGDIFSSDVMHMMPTNDLYHVEETVKILHIISKRFFTVLEKYGEVWGSIRKYHEVSS